MRNRGLYILLGVAFIISLLINTIVFGYANISEQAFTWKEYIKLVIISWIALCGLLYAINSAFSYYTEVDENSSSNLSAPEHSVQFYYNNYLNGFCRVEKITVNADNTISSEINYLNKQGEYISDNWYAAGSDFYESGVAIVYDGELFNIIDTTGKLISSSWFYGITPFEGEIAKVYWSDNTVNFINTKGELLWKNWQPEIALNSLADKENIE